MAAPRSARSDDGRLELPPATPLHAKFDSWLTSTFQSPVRKPPKRTTRLLRPLLGHSASLPTVSAAPAPRPKRPVVLPSIESIQRTRFEALVTEASYASWAYPSSGPQPGLLFTKVLGTLPANCGVAIPATLVRETDGTFQLVYSTADRRLVSRLYPSKAAVEEDAPRLVRLLTRRAHTIAVVVKKPDAAMRANTLELLETKQDVARALRALLLASAGIFGLQEFVPAKSQRAQTALMVRVAWFSAKPAANVAWVFSDSAHPVVDTTDATACRVDKATAPASWAEPRQLTQRIAVGISAATSMQFRALVADFVQDDEGGWWCLQVKAFRVAELKARPEVTKAPTAKCTGLFCRSMDEAPPLGGLPQTLLYKDILRGNFFSQNSGLSNASAAYEAYAQSWSRKVRNLLYNRVVVCGVCFHRYSQLLQENVPSAPVLEDLPTQQLLASIEALLPSATEAPMPIDANASMVVSSNQNDSEQADSAEKDDCEAFVSPRREATPRLDDVPIESANPAEVVAPAIEEHFSSLQSGVLSSPPRVSAPSLGRANSVDSFWTQLQPSRPAAAPTPVATPSIVVLPKHFMVVQATALFFDDQYKQSVLLEIQSMMAEMHSVVVTADDGNAGLMALQSLFLEVQDDCIEGRYGLDAVAISNGVPTLTVTPHFTKSAST
ncbi:hypothetical protein ACHHYP_01675 [Achlya hypogyna]|uniref:Uncharacterized protein n=1 Tax=Achlya hypogyna TaxID=1202772 RepID=A0A1V9Z829_ACHHY|nr:hypothetical protein ACHHYP_01675 [Achlya hypogyna]